MKRLLLAMMLLMGICMGADAQGFLNRLKDKAVQTVQGKVENKVEQTVSDEMDDVLDGKKSNKKSKKSKNEDADEEEAPTKKSKTAKGEEVKSDFVPGDVAIFEDNLQGEQLGEFPSKWDLIENNAEVARMNGKWPSSSSTVPTQ